MRNQASRRQFLQVTAAVTGYWVVERGAKESYPANERVQFAGIGINGKGSSDSRDCGQNGDVVAICDVDTKSLDKAGMVFPRAKKYFDFREMLDQMENNLDAVTVSTPDLTHAVAAAKAMRMGKHAFVQKPMTQTVYEARLLAEIATENQLATQMGNQGTASPSLRKISALIQAGSVGTVREAHAWTDRPIWPSGVELPPPESVPTHLKWDLWQSRVNHEPYRPCFHPHDWRGWWEYGAGALGDMGCHTLNMPFMALDLRNPVSVSAESSGHDKVGFPASSVIHYEFGATEQRPRVSLFWYDGGRFPKAELFDGAKIPKTGALIIGDQGKLLSPGDYAEQGYTLLGDAEDLDVKYERSPGHFVEWVRAIKGGPVAVSNFPDYAGPLTEVVLLGNLAMWADGKKIEWDAKNLKALNAPELDTLINPELNNGFEL